MSNQQEEDDIAKAIQLSLQESKASSSQQVKTYLNFRAYYDSTSITLKLIQFERF